MEKWAVVADLPADIAPFAVTIVLARLRHSA
jgi:hypothetical protein